MRRLNYDEIGEQAVSYRPSSGEESDGRFDLGGRGGESASAVVREGTTLAVGRDVAVAPAVAAEALRDTRTWPEWGLAISAVESDAGESDRSRVVVEVPVFAAWYVPVCRRALDRFAALVES